MHMHMCLYMYMYLYMHVYMLAAMAMYMYTVPALCSQWRPMLTAAKLTCKHVALNLSGGDKGCFPLS